MENKYVLLALVVLATVALTDLHAHRDEVSARRFRELYPETVQSELDRIRNARWHRLGFVQRLVSVFLLALVVTCYTDSGVAGGLAFGIGGGLTACLFDVFLNVRLKMPWDYVGTTSVVDQHTASARATTLIELSFSLLLCLIWCIFL